MQDGAARTPTLLLSPGLLRRVATSRAAHEALDVLLLEAEARGVAADGLREQDCAQLITAAFEQGVQRVPVTARLLHRKRGAEVIRDVL